MGPNGGAKGPSGGGKGCMPVMRETALSAWLVPSKRVQFQA